MTQPGYSERFDRAVALAVADFRDVKRKGTGVPYITHLLMVTAIVGEHHGDEDQLIAAMLHDWLEDIDGATPERLEAEFGPRVRRLVHALSDTVERPKPAWQERKDRYLRHLRNEPAEVKLISAADKLHNCRTIVADHRRIGEEIFARFNPTKEQTLWYYRGCHGALADGWDHPLVHELGDEVARLHTVSGVRWDR